MGERSESVRVYWQGLEDLSIDSSRNVLIDISPNMDWSVEEDGDEGRTGSKRAGEMLLDGNHEIVAE